MWAFRLRGLCANSSPFPNGREVGRGDPPPEKRHFANLTGRLGKPEDQAKAVLFLVWDDSAFVFGNTLLGRTDLDPICDRIRELEWRSKGTNAEFPLRGFRFTEFKGGLG